MVLPAPGVADDRHRLSRLDGEGNVLENPVDVVERGQTSFARSELNSAMRASTQRFFCSGVSF